MNHVLEHIPDPVRFLQSVVRTLDPEGLLVAAVPNFSSIGRRLLRQFWHGLQPQTHVVHFERASLRQVMDRAGLDTLSILSRTTIGTTYHVYVPERLTRRLFMRFAMPLFERLGETDQLIAVARVSRHARGLIQTSHEVLPSEDDGR